MKLPQNSLPLLGFSFVAAFAQETPLPEYTFPEFLITPEAGLLLDEAAWQRLQRQPQAVQETPVVSLAHALADVPGVDAQRRGANSLEPNIRGFSGDRVATSLNGLLLPNGSPTRTGSPVNYFGPGSLGWVRLRRSLPSVTLGPLSTGARIDLESFAPGLPLGDFDQGGAGYDFTSNNQGHRAYGYWQGRDGATVYRASAHYAEHGDYVAGNGDEVDGDYEAWGSSVALRHQFSSQHELTLAASYFRQELARNNSLPLDSTGGDFLAVTLQHDWALGELRGASRAGWSLNDGLLSTRDRVTPPAVIAINAETDTYSLAGGVQVQREFGETDVVMGLDYTGQFRDALRTRETLGGTFADHLWPDIEQHDLGGFAEVSQALSSDFQLQIGGRLDVLWAQAHGAGDAVAGFPPGTSLAPDIRGNYVAFNGAEAGDTSRVDLLGGGNVLLSWQPTDTLTWHAGAGLSVAAPGATERYRAFVNALGGGFEIGNPALNSEKTWLASTGWRWEENFFQLDAEAYYAYVEDFHYRTAIQAAPLVYGFRQIDAQFYGAEATARLLPFAPAWEGLSLPVSLAYAAGDNLSSGNRLAEIAPWQLTTGARIEDTQPGWRWWGEMEVALTGSRSNPTPAEVPIFQDSAGFDLWSLRTGVAWDSGLSLELAIENLFDTHFYHYLQPPVAPGPAPSSGDLVAGDRIPGPGRSVNISLKWQF